MDEVKGITYLDKLRLREIEVERTMRHLEKERREIEENAEWIDRAAYVGIMQQLEITRQKGRTGSTA